MDTCNKNATKEARELLNFLAEISGKKIITGQHTQTLMKEEISYIKKLTGHEPMLQGFELLGYSPNINYYDAGEACLSEVRENQGTLQTALEYGRSGGIVTFSWHWFSPIGGRDKSFYAEHTDFDPDNILIDGSLERKAFYSDMKMMSGLLQRFYDEKLPVLWRPFHEADGKWFWWGRKGPETACKLYILMYKYFVEECHLDNLIWVWNCPLSEGYPGDEYVDVISRDIYTDKHAVTDYKAEYDEMIRNTTSNKVAALAENGVIPDVNLLMKSNVPWAYYMTWSKEFCIGEEYNTEASLKAMYASDYSIKRS